MVENIIIGVQEVRASWRKTRAKARRMTMNFPLVDIFLPNLPTTTTRAKPLFSSLGSVVVCARERVGKNEFFHTHKTKERNRFLVGKRDIGYHCQYWPPMRMLFSLPFSFIFMFMSERVLDSRSKARRSAPTPCQGVVGWASRQVAKTTNEEARKGKSQDAKRPSSLLPSFPAK